MLEILYRDPWLVAVYKPSGLLVHRSQIDAHATQNAMALLRDQIGQWVYPVHRLDKPVSGVLLFALDSDTATSLTQAFSTRETRKTYLALVRGYCPDEGTIDHPLKEQLDEATDSRASPDPPAKPAITQFTRLAKTEIPEPVGRYSTARYSLMSLRPTTGRKHQLRRHMKHIFHPIVGDTTHGDGRHNVFFRQRFNANRLMLTATELEINHPNNGERIRIKAQPDPSFIQTLASIGLKLPPDPH